MVKNDNNLPSPAFVVTGKKGEPTSPPNPAEWDPVARTTAGEIETTVYIRKDSRRENLVGNSTELHD